MNTANPPQSTPLHIAKPAISHLFTFLPPFHPMNHTCIDLFALTLPGYFFNKSFPPNHPLKPFVIGAIICARFTKVYVSQFSPTQFWD